MSNVIKLLTDNWKTIAAVVGAIVVTASLTGILVSNYDRRVYEEKLKSHDVETAKRLTEAFVAKIEEIKKRYKKQRDEFVKRVKEACDKYDVSYNLVLKPSYI